MSKLSDFWKTMIDETRSHMGKLLVPHEEVVAYAIRTKQWQPQPAAVAKIARQELKQAVAEIGYRNERGEFVRTALPVKTSQGWVIGGLSDAPETYLREYVRKQVNAVTADAKSIVTLCSEIKKSRGFTITLPKSVREAAKLAHDGDSEAAA